MYSLWGSCGNETHSKLADTVIRVKLIRLTVSHGNVFGVAVEILITENSLSSNPTSEEINYKSEVVEQISL